MCDSNYYHLGSKLYLLLAILVAVLILCLAPLTQSLWVDEAISYWVASASLTETFDRAITFQGQSPLYFILLWVVIQIAGLSEIVLRAPSLICFFVSCVFLYRLAEDLFDKETASISLLLFICCDGVLRAGFSARPYSAALMCSLGAMLALIYWIRGGKLRHQALYVLLSVGAIYFHYLYAGMLIIHLIYVAFTKPADRAVTSRQVLAALLVMAVLFLPAIFHVLRLATREAELAYALMPTAVDLLKSWLPITLLVYVITPLVFVWAMFRVTLKQVHLNLRKIGFLVIWWLLPATLFFAYSHASGHSLFIERFFLWNVPALVILAALLLSSVNAPKARVIAVVLACLLIAIREGDRVWQIENWAEAVNVINGFESEQKLPLLAYSGLVESDRIAWLKDEDKLSYILAPLAYYPVQANHTALPSNVEAPDRKNYFETEVVSKLRQSDSLLFLCAYKKRVFEDGTQVLVHDYYNKIFSEHGFQSQALVSKGEVLLFKLDRR
ncbi:glycosyltransferase family 39 protein [Oligoflexia bacterium]|nr:glycosyltransferase family 39 protein [Oligoflexia bacterium]